MHHPVPRDRHVADEGRPVEDRDPILAEEPVGAGVVDEGRGVEPLGRLGGEIGDQGVRRIDLLQRLAGVRAHRSQDHRQGDLRGDQLGAGQAQGRRDDHPRRAFQAMVERIARQLQHLVGAVQHWPGPKRLDPHQPFQEGTALVGFADRHDRQVVVGNRLRQRRGGVEIEPRDLHPAPFDHQLQRRVGHQIAGGDQHQHLQPFRRRLVPAVEPPRRQRHPLALQRPHPVAGELVEGPQLHEPGGARRARSQRRQPLLDQRLEIPALEGMPHEPGGIGGGDRLQRGIDANGGGH